MVRRAWDANWWTPRVRDFLLFVGGFLGSAYETIVEQVDRPALLALFGGMLGLPLFLKHDEKEQPDDDQPTPKKERADD
jgi:TctA family transporter